MRRDPAHDPGGALLHPFLSWQSYCKRAARIPPAMTHLTDVTSRPAIRWGMTAEEEARAFDALKPRLARLWAEVFPKDDEPYTSVIVPSVTLDDRELARLGTTHHYEEALLFLLMRLRNPQAHVVYVTAQPIPLFVMDYYLHFLAGMPASHAASRLTLLSVHDGSPGPLTQKILDRPRIVEKIRAAIPDLGRAYMTVFRATTLEKRLATLLGIPLNAADPELETLCTRAAGRPILREAGVEVPAGFEDLRDEEDLVAALQGLARRRPGPMRAVLRLENAFWKGSRAFVEVPPAPTREALRRALRPLGESDGREGSAYLDRFARGGGMVEEYVEDVAKVVSGQIRINPRGEVILTSTHDELRGGPHRLDSVGCVFPADDRCRRSVQEAALRVGRVLAGRGLVSRLSVEFLLCAGTPAVPWRLVGSEINLGVGGATHPLLAVRFLTGGRLEPETGLFRSLGGQAKFYCATDNLHSDAYRRLPPEDLIDILTLDKLHYSAHGETGTLFYMLGAIAELGRVGMVAIGNSRDEAETIFRRTVGVLDAASVWPPPR
jgi:hypothetical protein